MPGVWNPAARGPIQLQQQGGIPPPDQASLYGDPSTPSQGPQPDSGPASVYGSDKFAGPSSYRPGDHPADMAEGSNVNPDGSYAKKQPTAAAPAPTPTPTPAPAPVPPAAPAPAPQPTPAAAGPAMQSLEALDAGKGWETPGEPSVTRPGLGQRLTQQYAQQFGGRIY